MPLLAYIGGKKAAFTSKDHNFFQGSSFGKQLIIINNSRRDIMCECSWSLNLSKPIKGNKKISLSTGQQERISIEFDLPDSLLPGTYQVNSLVKFSTGELQNDSFEINVLPKVAFTKSNSKTALFDPKGETREMLDNLGIQYELVDSTDDLTKFDLLIVGKEALTVNATGIDVNTIRNGLKVILFEQTSEVLEKRFGFRVQQYGLRQVFKRITDHPTLNELNQENLHDWQGASTILSSKLNYETSDSVFNGSPTVKWCDIPVTRIWRCGNRGNVASVLIEKPVCGDFIPIVDGGYSLQYSPLMEYREGKGMVLFCQMDVTGRTEKEPAAEHLVGNIISYVSDWKPEIKYKALYAGDPAGFNHLVKTGVSVLPFENNKLSPDVVLIAGPGGGKILSSDSRKIGDWITKGGRLICIGLNYEDVEAFLPVKITIEKKENISTFFEIMNKNSIFAGIGPSDLHNRDPKDVPLVSGGAEIIGNGVLAKNENAHVLFFQLVPWECDYSNEKHNVKQTYRRSSFALSRLLGNIGAESSTPLLDRFKNPVDSEKEEKRWLTGLYLDLPEEWDDPYRFFRW